MPRKKSHLSDVDKSAKFTEAIDVLIASGDFDVSQADRLMDKIIREGAKKPSAK